MLETRDGVEYYNGSSYTFTWNGRELAKAVKGGVTTTYKYGADGLRTQKKSAPQRITTITPTVCLFVRLGDPEYAFCIKYCESFLNNILKLRDDCIFLRLYK